MRVEGLEGRPDRLVDSQILLRTPDNGVVGATKRLVDLDLVAEGDSFVPDNGTADVELPRDLADGVELGPVTVTPAGDGEAVRLDADTLAYPGVDEGLIWRSTRLRAGSRPFTRSEARTRARPSAWISPSRPVPSCAGPKGAGPRCCETAGRW